MSSIPSLLKSPIFDTEEPKSVSDAPTNEMLLVPRSVKYID